MQHYILLRNFYYIKKNITILKTFYIYWSKTFPIQKDYNYFLISLSLLRFHKFNVEHQLILNVIIKALVTQPSSLHINSIFFNNIKHAKNLHVKSINFNQIQIFLRIVWSFIFYILTIRTLKNLSFSRLPCNQLTVDKAPSTYTSSSLDEKNLKNFPGFLIIVGTIVGVLLILMNILLIGCCLHRRSKKRVTGK